MSSKSPIVLLFEDDQFAFSCASRDDLSNHQAELEKLSGVTLLCGCSSAPRPRVRVSSRLGYYFPLSAKGDRTRHAVGCGLPEVDQQLDDRCSARSPFEIAFENAYGRQFVGRDFNFAQCLSAELEISLGHQSPGARFCVETFWVHNEPVDRSALSSGDPVQFKGYSRNDSEVDFWRIPRNVKLHVRTASDGITMPGLHLMAGAAPEGTAPSEVYGWPVRWCDGLAHTIHSGLEARFLSLMDGRQIPLVKPPSASFLSLWSGTGREAVNALGATGYWPDFLLLSEKRVLVVEVAGLLDAKYISQLNTKGIGYDQLSNIGVYWVVVWPEGDGFRLGNRSLPLFRFNTIDEILRAWPGFDAERGK